MRTPLLMVLLGGAACAAPPGAPYRIPASWRLVERAEAGGPALVLEPEEADAGLEISVRLSRREASLGEEVEAEILLPGARGRRRIEVRPGRPDVRILGAACFDVTDEGPARVRFTCGSAGPGGIRVLVKEVDR